VNHTGGTKLATTPLDRPRHSHSSTIEVKMP
jgi:hypothetical protein